MRPFGDGLWTHDIPFTLLGAEFGARMSVLQTDAGLILYSPSPIDDALAEEIELIGPVRWIVAPNTFHHLSANAAKARWPDATLMTARGLTKKVKGLRSDAVFDDGAAPAEWGDAIEAHVVGGMPKLNEVTLLHRPSRTLVLTDFFFNFTEGGWWTRTFLKTFGAYGGPLQSRLLRSAMKDMEAVKRSRDVLLDHDFDRVVIAHGEPFEAGGKDALRAATEWMG